MLDKTLLHKRKSIPLPRTVMIQDAAPNCNGSGRCPKIIGGIVFMPTCGYRCEACENSFEVFQKVDDKPIRKCPSCGGKTVRVFYPVGIVFKGSGFYKTDNQKRPQETKSNKQQDKKSETKSKVKTDTKENEKSFDSPQDRPVQKKTS